MTKTIMLCGVGGQGNILAGKILSEALKRSGYDVKMSEVHGMAQRGGSVTTQVRYSNDVVYSPLSLRVDLLVAFELLEGLRWRGQVSEEGTILLNNYRVMPAPVLLGKADYPVSEIEAFKRDRRVLLIPAADIAREALNLRVMNVVLLGAMAPMLSLDTLTIKEVMVDLIKPEYLDANVNALMMGSEYAAASSAGQR